MGKFTAISTDLPWEVLTGSQLPPLSCLLRPSVLVVSLHSTWNSGALNTAGSSVDPEMGEVIHNAHSKLKYMRVNLSYSCLSSCKCSLVELNPFSDGAGTTPRKCNQVANEFAYFQWPISTGCASVSYSWAILGSKYIAGFHKMFREMKGEMQWINYSYQIIH